MGITYVVHGLYFSIQTLCFNSVFSLAHCWNKISIKYTVPSYINYSSAQFIYISSFLLKRIVLPILFLGGITKRIYQNNMVDIPHSYKIDCPRSKDAQASGCCSQAHGKNLLTIPVCTAFHCMTVSTSRYHQHLAWVLSQHSVVTHRYKFLLWNPS